MKNKLVTVSYRQHIDATIHGWFEKGIIDASYDEFLLKSQAYNLEKKFKTFQEMVANDGRANSLHYKCGFPIIPYVDLLKNKIPGLSDNTGNPVIFKIHQLHIIDSDINDKLMHKVSITYFTDALYLIDNFGEYLLLANENFNSEDEISNCFLLKIVPQLSIESYKRL